MKFKNLVFFLILSVFAANAAEYLAETYPQKMKVPLQMFKITFDRLVIDSLNGVVAANSYSASYGLLSKKSMSVTLENGGIFAGTYTVSVASGQSAVTNICSALEQFSGEGRISALGTINDFGRGYAVSSGDGDDMLALTGKSAVIGAVSLAGGRNTISIESGSYLHGCISADAGSLCLNMKLTDSTADALYEPDFMPGSSREGDYIVHPGVASLISS